MKELLEELADRQAIADQIHRYCRSVDRLDVALGYTVFHEDAEADYGEQGYRGSGRGAIDWICAAHADLLHHMHQAGNVLIELDGDRAGSETYVTATLRMAREGKTMQIETHARYCDRWSKRGGHWAIDRREAVIEFDAIREVTPMKSHAHARRDRGDPSYAALEIRP